MQFSFLTSGPVLEFEEPVGYAPLPYLESPILSGVGGRSFVFTPTPDSTTLADELAQNGEYLDTLTDKDGREVVLSRRLSPPLTWWLQWTLRSGILTTHLREVDGADRAGVVVQSLSVDESGPTPFLLLSPPLKRFVSSFPGYQEFAYARTPGLDEEIAFLRPSFLSPGETLSAPMNGFYFERAGTSFGAEVQVAAGSLEMAESLLSQVLQTLSEAQEVTENDSA